MQRWIAKHVTRKHNTSTLSSSSGSSKISHSAITTGVCWTTLRMRKRCVPASKHSAVVKTWLALFNFSQVDSKFGKSYSAHPSCSR
jgi:hypothetical protein